MSLAIGLLSVILLAAGTAGQPETQVAGKAVKQLEHRGVAYEMRGEGDAVLFLSGTGLDRRLWDEQVEVFARDHTVLRFDTRGTGRSKVPTGPYDPSEELREILGKHAIDRVTLIGQSGGGSLAIDFALKYPDLVTRLVLVAPGVRGFPFPLEEIQRFQKMAMLALLGETEKSVELMLADPYLVPAMENETLAKKLRAIYSSNQDMWRTEIFTNLKPIPWMAIDRLAELSVPVLILVGDRDIPMIHEIATLLEEKIEGAKKVEVPGAGHLLNLEKPREFNRIVREFLGRS